MSWRIKGTAASAVWCFKIRDDGGCSWTADVNSARVFTTDEKHYLDNLGTMPLRHLLHAKWEQIPTYVSLSETKRLATWWLRITDKINGDELFYGGDMPIIGKIVKTSSLVWVRMLKDAKQFTMAEREMFERSVYADLGKGHRWVPCEPGDAMYDAAVKQCSCCVCRRKRDEKRSKNRKQG